MEKTMTKSWIDEDGKLRKTEFRIIPIPPGVAWQVMTDHAGYADIADNLSKVEVVSGHGLGMLRRCYAFTLDTNAPDYPYPLTELKGTWRVEQVEQGS